VPLSSSALRLLASIPREAGNPLVFLSPTGKVLSDSALSKPMRQMKAQGYFKEGVPHGFRTTLTHFATEARSYALEVANKALAHKLKDRVLAAYMRSDLFEIRTKLMQEWADYCETGVTD